MKKDMHKQKISTQKLHFSEMTSLNRGILQRFISPSKTSFLTQSNWFFHGRNYFFQKDRQRQRASDLSLLPHLFHNHARARATVGLSLALVSHRRNRTYTWYFVVFVYIGFMMYTATLSMRCVAQAISSSWKKNKKLWFLFANHVFVLRTSDHVIWLVDDDDDHNTSVVVVCRPLRNPKKG